MSRRNSPFGVVSTHSHAEAAASVRVFICLIIHKVSTHSHAEAAARLTTARHALKSCFNTQPRGGGCYRFVAKNAVQLGFNTQPRGGGCRPLSNQTIFKFCFNTQPRGGGCYVPRGVLLTKIWFQHTATRRRLRALRRGFLSPTLCFNTQPRGGGCLVVLNKPCQLSVSTHSHAEAAAPYLKKQGKSAN